MSNRSKSLEQSPEADEANVDFLVCVLAMLRRRGMTPAQVEAALRRSADEAAQGEE